MAFDQPTRNRLARFVGDARSLLTEEFTRQLQHEYGIDPANGEVTAMEKLTALDDARRETARILRETILYYQSQSQAKPMIAIDRILREQAFTVLNRLCALRMAEARGILLEAVVHGYKSKGFQLYARLAGSALGETSDAYRTYLFSLIDELAVELPPLFDRFSPQGRLFPRESALLRLLSLLNDPEMETLWAEDETIGWIYQYFNSKEERQAMRAESSAPRNSRELAVRNQFFTPRYVVEFLTDNTLGRIWYEMARGETILKETCQYLVRRPNEIFLNEGEEAPKQPEIEDNLSQEELLRQPVYIPHRPLKDPRELKMLDPACGSMHFGLYAFDLYEQIYIEAWNLEEALGANALWRLADLEPLHRTYPDRETFLRDVPRLIIERNIHGIDIDPRAVQIAGLSLWLRAQKSWQAQGVKPGERPQICKSNIVCAEPMPGDRDMLEEFLGTLKEERLDVLMRRIQFPPAGQKLRATRAMADALVNLVRKVWQEMELAGEAGSLLKIEETLREAIIAAHKESEEKAPLFRVLEFGMDSDMHGEVSVDFWDRAEALTLAALKEYADQANDGTDFRRRLFVGDASLGFALIDLYRKRYDVVLMNPPFGDLPEKAIAYLRRKYLELSENLYCGFLLRANEITEANGLIGAITDRSYLVKQSFEKFREQLLVTKRPVIIIGLGWGVLDANVETCGVTFRKKIDLSLYADVGNLDFEKEQAVLGYCAGAQQWQCETLETFKNIPYTAFAFTMPHWVRQAYSNPKNRLDESLCRIVRGMAGSNSDFLYRNICEVNPEDIGRSKKWSILQKGSPYNPFYFPPEYLLLSDEGRFLTVLSYESGRITGYDDYGKPGLSFGKRTDLMYAYVMTEGQVFSVEGQAIFPLDADQIWQCLAIINSAPFQLAVNTICGQHKLHGYVNAVHFASAKVPNCGSFAKEIFLALQEIDRFNELSLIFVIPLAILNATDDPTTLNIVQELIKQRQNALHKVRQLHIKINKQIAGTFNAPEEITEVGVEINYISNLFGHDGIIQDEIHNLSSWFLGISLGRWDIRFATGERPAPELPDPFAPLPACPPGMLQNAKGLPAAPEDVPADYPLRITWGGILVDDEGHPEDIEGRTREALHVIWQARAEAIEAEACQILGVRSLREYFRKPALFFADHLKRYSKSRRQAPIYWPLSTPSGSYTLWLYYHHLSDQTLFSCVNDFIDPKIQQASADAARLRQKTGRSAADEKELERLSDLERELKDFRTELLRVAAFWKPNLNDGVEITAAPLWRLFQHKPWQRRLKETWGKLEAGDYDWAHLAYSIWPERVREKCKMDKSLAIAHDLEHLYVEPKAPLKKKKGTKQADMELEDLFDEN